MVAARKVCVFTGTRAEYGLLRHLIKAIASDPLFALQLIVSGSHLSEQYGLTVAEIESDGVPITARVSLTLDSDPPATMVTLSAEAMAGVGQALEQLQPQLLILLGDRYETFAAAAAAHLQCIPIAHLHGGETTGGAVDDKLRHAISQLSTWHFTAAEPYRQRVIAMGHPPKRVHNVGPMVLDGLSSAPVGNRSAFTQATGFHFGERNLLITYHPETLLPDRGIGGFETLLKALEKTQCQVMFTHPNADAGSDQLMHRLQAFCQKHPERCLQKASLGQQRYLEALQLFEGMAGNSSSGLIEAPLVHIPVLNIGGRQSGRLRHGPVYDVETEVDAIAHGLERILSEGKRSCWPRPLDQERMSPSASICSWLQSEF